MDQDLKIAEAIATTTKELESAREVVRNLANELADVIDVIEPTLAEHTQRLRAARMASIDELRQIAAGIREVRDSLLSTQTEAALVRGERFLAMCRELEEFRASGFLDAYIRLLATPVEALP